MYFVIYSYRSLRTISTHHNNGFTFLELAIVLTVIALVAGAILVGKDLIHSSELLSVSSDVKKISAAINTFHDKYGALPGDFSKATDIWGTSPDGCAGATIQTTTCNGNGDGRFYYCLGFCGDTGNLVELFTFWQHLSNAGLMEGQFTGGAQTITDVCTIPPAVMCPSEPLVHVILVPGRNVPKSKLTGGNYTIYGGATRGSLVLNFTGLSGDGYTTAFILTPADARSIDLKMDDGLPGTGTVTSTLGGNCATSSDPTTALYNTTYQDRACVLVFNLTGA